MNSYTSPDASLNPRVPVRRRHTNKGIPFAVLLSLCTWAAPVALGQDADVSTIHTPRSIVQSTTEAVSELVLDRKLTDRVKRQRVLKLIEGAVDFPTVSKLVLARNYRKFSSAQRTEFTRLFKLHLLATYWKDVKGAKFDRIAIEGERKEKRKDWTVKTAVVQGSEKTTMDYRLRLFGEDDAAGDPSTGDWRIIDITIEGVSLVSNFRSQFQSIVAEQGPEGLLRLLAKKNAANEKAAAGG